MTDARASCTACHPASEGTDHQARHRISNTTALFAIQLPKENGVVVALLIDQRTQVFTLKLP
jgi:hypothetical protein